MIKKLAWLITVIAVSLFSGGVQAKASVEEMAYFLLSCMSEFEDQLVIDDMLTAFQVAASKQRNFDPARAKRDLRNMREAIQKNKKIIIHKCKGLTDAALRAAQGGKPIVSQFSKDGMRFLAEKRAQKMGGQVASATRLKMSSGARRLRQLLDAPQFKLMMRNTILAGEMSECLGNKYPIDTSTKIGLIKFELLLLLHGEHPSSDIAKDVLGMHQLLLNKGRKNTKEKPSRCQKVIRAYGTVDFSTINKTLKSDEESLRKLRKQYGLPPS